MCSLGRGFNLKDQLGIFSVIIWAEYLQQPAGVAVLAAADSISLFCE